jgi:hypothetical protein
MRLTEQEIIDKINGKKELCFLTPSTAAEARTKNRLRDHGPKFEIIKKGTPVCMDGSCALLVRSVKTDWTGWLENIQIIID